MAAPALALMPVREPGIKKITLEFSPTDTDIEKLAKFQVAMDEMKLPFQVPFVRKAQEDAKPKLYRMLRVLEYSGTREFLEDHIKRRGVKGTRDSRFNSSYTKPEHYGVITEAFIGEIPELLLGRDLHFTPPVGGGE